MVVSLKDAIDTAQMSLSRVLEEPTYKNKKTFLADYDLARKLGAKPLAIGAPQVIGRIVLEMLND
jgi:hypothetical protein